MEILSQVHLWTSKSPQILEAIRTRIPDRSRLQTWTRLGGGLRSLSALVSVIEPWWMDNRRKQRSNWQLSSPSAESHG